MIVLAIGALLAMTTALTSVRLFVSTTLQDRVLAINAIILQAALICAAGAAAFNSTAGADAAILLVLALLLLSVATLKFFRSRTFQAPLARDEESA